MTATIIITFCVLMLIAYIFDLTASKTKIPSVILLLLLGWSIRQLVYYFGIPLPGFRTVLPTLGTVGLILIVLEGSLELEFNKSKLRFIISSFLGALIPMVLLGGILTFLFTYYGNFGIKLSLYNAIPLCIISSAVAIPSVRYLSSKHKEFVTYESSLSDIIGVLIFNFLALNEIINLYSFQEFGLQLLIIFIISFVATIGLSYLLNKIEHHIKFVPIILMVILIYEVAKVYNLPGLIFILMFGLFIGNLGELKHFKILEKFHTDELSKEVQKFKELTTEAAFLIRAPFFLIFGFFIETSEVLNPDTLVWAAAIVFIILVLRMIQLKLSGLPLMPLLFIAPRGLITILLFLSIESNRKISIVDNSLIIQVIILTGLLMMFGLVTSKSNRKEPTPAKKSLQEDGIE